MAMPRKIYFSKWSMQLKQYLHDIGDERQNDVEFINDRVDIASAAFEDARHQGMDPNQAMEVAHAALMEGFNS